MACLMGDFPKSSIPSVKRRATDEYRNGCRIIAYVELDEEEDEPEEGEKDETETERQEDEREDYGITNRLNLKNLMSNAWFQMALNTGSEKDLNKNPSQQNQNEHQGKVKKNIKIFEAPSN